MVIKYDITEIIKVSQNIKKKTIKNTMHIETCEKIILKLQEEVFSELNQSQVLILITGLLQSGGSNKGAGNNISFEQEFNGKFYELRAYTLSKFISIIDKKATIRQFAKGINNIIAEISLALSLEGDLADQMRLTYPNISNEEACWCSNFQTSNPNCPIRVREWLVENYKRRFKN